jgi:hypothetical protein
VEKKTLDLIKKFEEDLNLVTKPQLDFSWETLPMTSLVRFLGENDL